MKFMNSPLISMGIISPSLAMANLSGVTATQGISGQIRMPVIVETIQLVIQLNRYETAPNFILFSQNVTSDCLLI